MKFENLKFIIKERLVFIKVLMDSRDFELDKKVYNEFISMHDILNNDNLSNIEKINKLKPLVCTLENLRDFNVNQLKRVTTEEIKGNLINYVKIVNRAIEEIIYN